MRRGSGSGSGVIGVVVVVAVVVVTLVGGESGSRIGWRELSTGEAGGRG